MLLETAYTHVDSGCLICVCQLVAEKHLTIDRLLAHLPIVQKAYAVRLAGNSVQQLSGLLLQLCSQLLPGEYDQFFNACFIMQHDVIKLLSKRK